MTTRKIVVIILAVIGLIVLAVLVFAGAIIGVAFYSVGHSEAAEASRKFLRNNEKLETEIGEVKDFGSFVTGSVSINSNNGQATINIKVIGARETVNASVNLVFTSGQSWRVISASYINKDGQAVNLQDPYDTRKLTSPPKLLLAA